MTESKHLLNVKAYRLDTSVLLPGSTGSHRDQFFSMSLQTCEDAESSMAYHESSYISAALQLKEDHVEGKGLINPTASCPHSQTDSRRPKHAEPPQRCHLTASKHDNQATSFALTSRCNGTESVAL
ncbi:hypothetical protein AOLI_G00162590 [Acnodon oligacanthus]